MWSRRSERASPVSRSATRSSASREARTRSSSACREDGAIAHKPAGITFEEAAAVCDGASIARACLKKVELREGTRILIYGATGAIGTAAVQLAKATGAHVTAVGNTKNLELVRSLGPDEVIDYLEEDFTENGETYDVIFDAVGMHSFRRCRRSLEEGGTFLETDLGFMWHVPFLILGTRWIGDKKVILPIPAYSKEDVLHVKVLIEAGKVSRRHRSHLSARGRGRGDPVRRDRREDRQRRADGERYGLKTPQGRAIPRPLYNQAMAHPDSFGARSTLSVGGRELEIFRGDALQARYDVARLPYTLRILLENVLRREDGVTVTARDVEAVAAWDAAAEPSQEISYNPARVLLQDFTGVPAVVDLAAMRAAMADLGGDPQKINPLIPVELVIDHSVQVDDFATRFSIERNSALEFSRNRERYAFLRWGQGAFANFKAVPPNTGICHQVNLEFLARVVEERDGQAFPDTVVGTDSHTTMVNGLGVLGWGVGGIEAEAAMLGEAISMLVPQVVGFRLHGALPEGATATDLVLTVTQILRQTGVVGKFVEYFGHGLEGLTLADRATLGNMSPEYGATCGFFPVDDETLRYLRLTGRSEEKVALVEAYCKETGLWHTPDEQSDVLPGRRARPLHGRAVDRRSASTAGPDPARRGAQRLLGSAAVVRRHEGNGQVDEASEESMDASDAPALTATAERTAVELTIDGETVEIDHGVVVIAAITSCTNTSNPAVMIGAGLAGQEGRRARAHASAVGEDEPRTRLARRHRVLRQGGADALPRGARLQHRRLRLHDLHRQLGPAARRGLGGRRERRPRRLRRPLRQPELRGAHPSRGEGELPRLAAARRRLRARRADGHRHHDRAARPRPGRRARLSRRPLALARARCRRRSKPRSGGTCSSRPTPTSTRARRPGASCRCRPGSCSSGRTHPPTCAARRTSTAWPRPRERSTTSTARAASSRSATPSRPITSPRPARSSSTHPPGDYLVGHGVERGDFNSYGSRRGNHEVMVRGTFANVRLRNQLVPGSEGTWTAHLPDGDETTIFEAAERYLADGVPTIVLAGKEYGSGSSRDWAAKGPNLLGVRAVIAESYERIHRSNLLMMGILPLQYLPGENLASLGLTGREEFSVSGVENGEAREVTVRADGVEFRATLRLDTPREREYVRHGGILPYVLRRLLAE